MKILIAGSSGLIGSELLKFLHTNADSVVRLVRSQSEETNDTIVWDTRSPIQIEDFDAIINLAGENIAARWTDEKKKRIRDSRINSTTSLVESILKSKNPPKVFINASAMGYYGNAGDKVLTEESPKGSGFLADVCSDWELSTLPLQKTDTRVVLLRTGMVLSTKGGALAKMLLPFKMGLGGVIGSGKQYISWVALEDVVHIIHFALSNPSLRGPINVGTPNPVTNEEFTKTLREVLNRPTLLPMPEFLAKLLFGEMGDELLLSSTRMLPQRLLQSGYFFIYPELKEALRGVISAE